MSENNRRLKRYGRCMKNHALATGGRAHDGCLEFMLDATNHDHATILHCAACGCHRSFHLPDGDFSVSLFHQVQQRQQELAAGGPLPYQQALHNYQLMFQQAEAVPRVAQTDEGDRSAMGFLAQRMTTQEERREQMRTFAERLGWRVRRQDEHAVRLFCSEMGVSKRAFVSWMRRNKKPKGASSSSEACAPAPSPNDSGGMLRASSSEAAASSPSRM